MPAATRALPRLSKHQSKRVISIPIRVGVLVALLSIMLGGCDLLREPPVPDWPGPHAPYPFPDNIPHRTE